LRVGDDSLDFRAWLESLGSLLAGKPLSHWHDNDISRFEINLAEMVRSFTSLETLAFEIKNKGVDIITFESIAPSRDKGRKPLTPMPHQTQHIL